MNTDMVRSAQAYWDLTAETYDNIFPDTLVGKIQRHAVWHEMDRVFHPGQRVLELNCGTGIDALHLAERGIRVLSCDISPRMIEIASQRLALTKFEKLVEFRVLPTEKIFALGDAGTFDGAFSNFSGLNCVENLSTVARDLGRLLKPGAGVVLCMVGRFVPLEIAWYLAHCNLGQAMQRLRRHQVTRVADDVMVKVQRPSVSAITRIFAPDFQLRDRTGVGIILPYCMESAARHVPKVLGTLARLDRGLGRAPVTRWMADCVVLRFERWQGEREIAVR
jgi:SAM-dependent methyltransferase